MRLIVGGAALGLVAGIAVACATNPVTGRSELSLVSESQEIQMGQQAEQEVIQSLGLVEDQAAQAMVDRIGKRMAAASERPSLPWSFHIADDPSVNAFALPGGPVFVTRGLMTHLNSEAELASVIGHEIGHITAKHAVSQMSRAQLAQIGLGVGSILSEDVARFSGLASTGLSLLFLKYGRDDEAQADQLGFKYALNSNYDVREMVDVFRTLERVSQSSGSAGALPEWLSSHPNPGNRIQATQQRLDTLSVSLANKTVGRQEYLQVINNMVYGTDPRNGYFRNALFLHPDLRFQLQFPSGWQTQNMTSAVTALSPAEDAVIQLTLAQQGASQAHSQFFSQQGVQAVQTNRGNINGLPAVTSAFQAQTDQGAVRGLISFIDYGGKTYRILGYTPAAKINTYDNDFMRAATSFSQLTDPAAINVQPRRIDLVRVPRAMTLEQFYQQYPSTVPIEQIALINDLQAGQTIAAGTTVKRVTGGS